MLEPFALALYRRFLAGESIEEIAAETSIPIDRVEMRIRAASRLAARAPAQTVPRQD